MAETLSRCTVCGGAREEHANSRHIYTENEGELITPEQQARRMQQQGRVAVPIPQGLLPQPTHPTITDRLVNVMLDKGLIDNDEALYILSGREMAKNT